MATGDSNRTVRLNIETGVTGQAEITELADGLRGVGDAAKGTTPDLDRMGRELEALAAATAKNRAAEAAARADAGATKRDFDAKRDALALLRAETDRSTKGTAEYEARERALRVAVVEARAALRDKQATVTAAAASARIAATAEANLAAQFKATGTAAAAAGQQQAAANREVVGTLDVLQGQLATLRNLAGVALGGSLVGSLARDLGETADAYNNLAARIKIATGEGAAFETTFAEVFKIAQRTGVAVEDVGALVTKLAQAGREMNLSSGDALALAESVAQATQLSGASATEAASAVTQFAQAIASGRLQGDELRSLLENSPRLARALADGLGVAFGQLKELGAAGSLTAAQVVAALQGQSAALQAEFDQLPLTVGRAITNLGTAWAQYVGQADAASGASKAAAEAIGALAANLDTVAGLLFGLGKAAAAYAALRLAQTFLANATAAGTLAAATTAATAATVANTAAQTANAAATAGSVAAAGRLAGILGTIKTLSFLGVVTNLESIGTAIGQGAARLMGYGKALEELEIQQRLDEAATRRNATAKAELAQRTEQATDRALGLTKESKTLIATFDGLALKGESVGDALDKIGKELDLSDVRGITTAGAALDALAQRGKITADQLRDTLGAALKGEDLGRFEAQARAAFDGSAQGVRRLQAAIDALADESLRRAGTSARELGTGFSAAATSAINDLDALAATLDRVGVKGDAAGRLLSKGVDAALAAAGTEKAVRAVIDRLTDLGASGKLAGDRVADGLQTAQRKLDDLRGGINSLDEALRAFGLKTRAEMQATADKLGQAYTVLAGRADVSLQDQAKAFATWRDAALAATGGVESGQIRLQRVMLENRLAAAGLGDSLESGMRKAKAATDQAAASQERYNSALSTAAGINGAMGASPADRAASVDNGRLTNTFGELFKNTPSGGITRTASGQLQPPDDSGDWFLNTARQREGAFGLGVWELTPEARARRDAEAAAGLADARVNDPGGFNGAAGYSPFDRNARPAPAPAPTSAPAPQPVPMNITIGGKNFSIGATNKAAADTILAALEEAYRAGGGNLEHLHPPHRPRRHRHVPPRGPCGRRAGTRRRTTGDARDRARARGTRRCPAARPRRCHARAQRARPCPQCSNPIGDAQMIIPPDRLAQLRAERDAHEAAGDAVEADRRARVLRKAAEGQALAISTLSYYQMRLCVVYGSAPRVAARYSLGTYGLHLPPTRDEDEWRALMRGVGEVFGQISASGS